MLPPRAPRLEPPVAMRADASTSQKTIGCRRNYQDGFGQALLRHILMATHRTRRLLAVTTTTPFSAP